jgi:hypothetical protein
LALKFEEGWTRLQKGEEDVAVVAVGGVECGGVELEGGIKQVVVVEEVGH